MASKLSFLVGFGAGYVLGARSGRERYEQIAEKAQRVWRDPRVQEKAGQAQQLAQEKAGQAGQAVKEKVAAATSSDGDAPSGLSKTATGTGATSSAGASGGRLP